METKLAKETTYSLWAFFIFHLAVYVVCNIFFLIINLIVYARRLWFYVPMIIWGLILVIQYFTTKLIVMGYFQELSRKLIARFEKWF